MVAKSGWAVIGHSEVIQGSWIWWNSHFPLTVVKGFEDFWLIVENVVGFFVCQGSLRFHFFLLWHDFFLSNLKHHVGYRRGGYGVEEGRGHCPSYRQQRRVPRVLWDGPVTDSLTILPVALRKSSFLLIRREHLVGSVLEFLWQRPNRYRQRQDFKGDLVWVQSRNDKVKVSKLTSILEEEV